MIPARDAWGPLRLDLDPAEQHARPRCRRAIMHLSTGHTKQRWSAAAEMLPVRLNTHARRASFGCLAHCGSAPKRHGYGSRRGVDGMRTILSVVVWAVLTRI